MAALHIREGQVSIHGDKVVGKIDGTPTPSTDTLFYNPAQVFNRDLSLLVAKIYNESRMQASFDRYDKANSKKYAPRELGGFTFCEPLAASCLRSLRYALELPSSLYKSGIAGDISKPAVESGCRNRELNNVSAETLKIIEADANMLMYAGQYVCGQSQWDVVDVDPYGSVSPFIDSAVKAVANNGLLCVTSTDMPILGGNSADVAFYKYGGNTLKARYLHEMSLRLVIHTLQMAAAKHRRYVKPLLSCSVDFYVRIWVTVHDQPIKCSTIASQTATVFQCAQCDWFCTIPFGHPVQKSKNTERNKRRKTARDAAPKSEDNPLEGDQPVEMADCTENITAETAENGCETAGVIQDGEMFHKADDATLSRVQLYPAADKAISGKFAAGRVPAEVCGSRCPMCDGALVVGGPCYAGPLHDYEFVKKLIKEHEKSETNENVLRGDNTRADGEAPMASSSLVPVLTESGYSFEKEEHLKEWVEQRRQIFMRERSSHHFTSLSATVAPKIKGLLTAILDEEPVCDVPFYYKLSSMCNDAHVSLMKSDRFKSALLNMGYRVGIFHREPQSIKTDAPASVVFDILKAWIQEETKRNPESASSKTPARYLTPINASTPEINFQYSPLLLKSKGPRFVPNPQVGWGPGRRAGR